ncbi:MAG: cofactor assembly of complex C subunit B [Synechococcales cyanobacterium]
MATESTGRLRRLPLLVGILGGSLFLINRLAFTPELLNSQSRADALGIALSAVLILTGLLWQQWDPPPPETVPLVGIPGFDPHFEQPDPDRVLELGWLTKTLLTTTPGRSLVILWRQQLVLRRGILRDPAPPTHPPLGSVMQRVEQTQQPVYLVDLKTYPAKQEFTPLFPDGIQSLLCQPLGQEGLLLVATDTPRSLTARDRLWISALAERLTFVLTEMNQN